MKLQFDKSNKDQMELFRAMGSKDKSVSLAAQEIFAQIIGPIISKLYMVEGTSSIFFKPFTYNENDGPSIAVDPMADWGEGRLSFWSQVKAGGIPTNLVTAPVEELRFQPFKLDTAISWDKKWNRKSRLDVVSKYMEMLYQEQLIKSEDNAWAVALAALAGSVNSSVTTNKGNIFHTQVAGTFSYDDLNKLFVVFRRQASAWNGGTPSQNTNKPTDLIISPEIEAKIRGFAYQPINTTGPNGLALSTSNAGSAGAVTLPEAERAAIFKSAGVPSFFGTNLIVINELGAGRRYETLVSRFIGSTALPSVDLNAAGTDTFDPVTDDFIIAINSAMDFAWRGYGTDSTDGVDNPNTPVLQLHPDDQFLVRSGRVGFFGGSEESLLVTETRGSVGLMV